MQDQYIIKSYDQARVLSHKLRMKITHLFEDEKPRTATHIAEELGMQTAKVHYHVRELMRVGLLELVETREKGGVLEKYYLPVAREIRIRLDEDDDTSLKGEVSVAKTILDEFYESHLKSLSKNKNNGSETYGSLSLTKEEERQFTKEMRDVFMKWEKKGENREGVKTFNVLYAIHEKN